MKTENCLILLKVNVANFVKLIMSKVKKIEFSSGTKKWFKNNKLHRIDGPAIIWCDNSEEWLKNGKLHCLTGPAKLYKKYQIDDIGIKNYYIKEWWINGIEYNEYDFNIKVNIFIRKYWRKWYFLSDKPGNIIWDNNINKGWKNINNIT